MADRVDSEEPRANEAIGVLRKAAVNMKAVGDELVAAVQRIKTLEAQVGEFEEQISQMQDDSEKMVTWENLLENFKRDLCDKDELLAATVGR